MVSLLLAPHLLLGAWLHVVPDYADFVPAQIVTLVHVGLILVTIPFFIVWAGRHVWRRGRTTASPPDRVARWFLAAAFVIACVTGAAVLRGGSISWSAGVHGVCGLLLAVPLAVHLWLSSRRWPAVACASLVGLALVGPPLARRALPPAHLEATSPTADFALRNADLYESAEWCARCHVQEYSDWNRSAHRRGITLDKVRNDLLGSDGAMDANLASLGHVFEDPAAAAKNPANFGCTLSCHSPLNYYGRTPEKGLQKTGLLSEGVTCSFCHTLRGIRADETVQRHPAIVPKSMKPDAIAGMITQVSAHVPYFVSAPETVRRYLGQGSHSRAGRWLADWLIRWRPEVHRQDYHPAFLDSSRACLACHGPRVGMETPDLPGQLFGSWERSRFNTGSPATTVTCQDCHMARQFTGAQVQEAAKEVPWGPQRQSRSHLFLGGNVWAAQAVSDEDMAVLEHHFDAAAIQLEIVDVRIETGIMSVQVAVKSNLVGHDFPGMDTGLRSAWIRVVAQDSDGKTIAAGPLSEPRPVPESFKTDVPFLYRYLNKPSPDLDTAVPPSSTRQFTARLSLTGNVRPHSVVAELRQTLDDKPFAVASRQL